MLYLEDYVELIEHLPVELREKFSDMREMDVQVQSTVDGLNGKVRELFRACIAHKGKVDNADEVFSGIRDTYYKALEDAEEKVQLANQIYDLVDRHLRKLDQELAKFKMELEADNAGITEILESRSLELDNNVAAAGLLHKRKHLATSLGANSQNSDTQAGGSNGTPVEKKIKTEGLPDLIPFHSESAPPSVYQSQDSSAPASGTDSDVCNSRPSSRNSVAACSQSQISAIQLAAAQAVQATAEMQVGRQTSSLKASYEAVKTNDFPIKEEIQSPAEVLVKVQNEDEDSQQVTSGMFGLNDSHDASIHEDLIDDDSSHSHPDGMTSPGHQGSRPSRTKKQTSKAAAWNQERMQAEARRGHARERDSTAVSPNNNSVVEMVNETANTSVEWPTDPNEPRYCICNQVSYGEMVGCDNERCTIEWFHYGCVGLTEAPKGKWYCPRCIPAMKRRNRNR